MIFSELVIKKKKEYFTESGNAFMSLFLHLWPITGVVIILHKLDIIFNTIFKFK